MDYQKPRYRYTSNILRLVQEVSYKEGQLYAKGLLHHIQNNKERYFDSKVDAIIKISNLEDRIVRDSLQESIENLGEIKGWRRRDLKAFHEDFFHEVDDNAGRWRKPSNRKLKNSYITHIAPPSKMVPKHLKNLFKYAKKDDELNIIKGAVLHFELVYLWPFELGSGVLARLWHNVFLNKSHTIIQHLDFERLWLQDDRYEKALQQSISEGESTRFIEFSLETLIASLDHLLQVDDIKDTDESRLEVAKTQLGNDQFTRKEYMLVHKTISSATASRDLRKGVDLGWLKKEGDRRFATYAFV